VSAHWAEGLPLEEGQHYRLENIARQWLDHDENAAREWIARSAMPDDVKQQLLQPRDQNSPHGPGMDFVLMRRYGLQ